MGKYVCEEWIDVQIKRAKENERFYLTISANDLLKVLTELREVRKIAKYFRNLYLGGNQSALDAAWDRLIQYANAVGGE